MKAPPLLISAFILFQTNSFAENTGDLVRAELRQMIGQMITVGFAGVSLPDTLRADLQDRNLGGVILLARNLQNPRQIQNLVQQINTVATTVPFIAIDQEGGVVARLDENNGYKETHSAFALGTNINKEDSTRATAAEMAGWLTANNINMNLAPVVDVNINPTSPAIGRYERSFSDDPMVVAGHAGWFAEEFNDHNIITTLKHFPGHGSAQSDSHLGFTDITSTWTEAELIPYQELIALDRADVVMTGHLFNAAYDSLYPASLSYNTITNLLRGELGFKGVVTTDEMFMRAITDNYGFAESVELAINAGTDILLYVDNLKDGNSVVRQIVEIVLEKIDAGKIAVGRIEESYDRILALKQKWFGIASAVPPMAQTRVPERFILTNYPNPFNAETTFGFVVERESDVNLRIYDVMGREVRTVLDKQLQAGNHTIHFAAGHLPSGVYFARLSVSGSAAVRKIALVK